MSVSSIYYDDSIDIWLARVIGHFSIFSQKTLIFARNRPEIKVPASPNGPIDVLFANSCASKFYVGCSADLSK